MLKKIFRMRKLLIKPSYVVFHITGLCDSRCKMCFNWRNISKKRLKEELTLDEIKKISQSFKDITYLTLGGGEPFLRKDIFEIVETFYDNNHIQFLSIPTNALRPKVVFAQTKKILDYCKDTIIKLSLSLDGINRDHDKIRGVKGNFKKLVETHDLLQQLNVYPNFELNIGTTFSHYNQDKMIKIYEFVKNNFNINLHQFTYARGLTREAIAKNVSPKKYQEFIHYLENDYKKSKGRKKLLRLFTALSVITRRKVLKEVLNQKSGKKRSFNCVAGKYTIHIDQVGMVYPCEYLYKSIGNLRDYNYDIKKMLKLDKSKELLKLIKKKKCTCTWECVIQDGLIYEPSSYMKILKNYFSY